MKRLLLVLTLSLTGASLAFGQFSATMQSGAVANGNGTVLQTTGMGGATLTVNCATCSGGTQVNFEGTADGTNYSAITGRIEGASTTGTTWRMTWTRMTPAKTARRSAGCTGRSGCRPPPRRTRPR